MGLAPQLVFPGALIGSLILALFGYLVTAGAALPESAAAASAQASGSTRLSIPIVNHHSLPSENENAGFIEVTGDADPITVPAGDLGDSSLAECRVSGRYPEKVRQWCQVITYYADKHGLDPDLIAALIWQESGGNPLAYSHSGAVGLMQVMPRDGLAANFMCKNGPCFTHRPSIDELQDPGFNVNYGTRMLAGLNGKYGNLRDALKYYGPMDVGYYYADKVLGIYQSYKQ